jgi:toxin HigB-1
LDEGKRATRPFFLLGNQKKAYQAEVHSFTSGVNEMNILFINDRLKKLCEDKSARQRAYQTDAADKLARRLDDLHDAANMAVMRTLPGSWEELKGDLKGHLSCRLDKKLRLVIKPSKQPPPAKPDGGLDWVAVDAITVVAVENYHD